MAVQFEFYRNPVQEEKEGEISYHPRVVNFQHVTTRKLAAEIHSATTFGKAEVEAMLMELSRCMGNHLREGQRVLCRISGFARNRFMYRLRGIMGNSCKIKWEIPLNRVRDRLKWNDFREKRMRDTCFKSISHPVTY